MTAPSRSAARHVWPRPARRLPVVIALVALTGCAAPARIEVPAELPLQTTDQFFDIRWALRRDAAVAQAVGRVKTSFGTEARLTLALYGVDAEGRIVSRGTTYAQSEFNRAPIPFAVELTPTGRQARFELQVTEYYLTGLRAD